MPFVTHFKDTDGQELPIAASTLVTVEIPAAGSADKGDWLQAAESTTEHYNQQAAVNAPKSSAVIPHCTDPSVFTDHGLTINYEEQLQGWVLWIDSLPETACTLTLLFINHSTEGTPCVLPALGVGGSGGGGVLEQAKRYTDSVTEYAWIGNKLVNLADHVTLEAAMLTPGGRVTVYVDESWQYEMSCLGAAVNRGPCGVLMGLTGAGDVEGNRVRMCLIPQVYLADHQISTAFVPYGDSVLYLCFYIYYDDSKIVYEVKKVEASPYLPAP